MVKFNQFFFKFYATLKVSDIYKTFTKNFILEIRFVYVKLETIIVKINFQKTIFSYQHAPKFNYIFQKPDTYMKGYSDISTNIQARSNKRKLRKAQVKEI